MATQPAGRNPASSANRQGPITPRMGGSGARNVTVYTAAQVGDMSRDPKLDCGQLKCETRAVMSDQVLILSRDNPLDFVANACAALADFVNELRVSLVGDHLLIETYAEMLRAYSNLLRPALVGDPSCAVHVKVIDHLVERLDQARVGEISIPLLDIVDRFMRNSSDNHYRSDFRGGISLLTPKSHAGSRVSTNALLVVPAELPGVPTPSHPVKESLVGDGNSEEPADGFREVQFQVAGSRSRRLP
jgi:hypothetical protein